MYITISTNDALTTISGFENYDIHSEKVFAEFENEDYYKNQLPKIIHTIKSHIDQATIQGIGIAHTGVVNSDKGIIVDASHTLDYEEHNIVKDLNEEVPNIPIYLQNDVCCAAIAESYWGQGKDAKTVGVVYISWGVGSAFIRRINNSFSLFSAENGHQIVELNGKTCVCGQRGCLEAYVGAKAIKQRFLIDQHKLDDDRIWEDLVSYMSIGATNLHTVFEPEVLVLSGKTMTEIDYVKNHLIEKISSQLRKPYVNTKIVFSEFNEKSPRYGALALLKIKEGGNSITTIE